MRPLLDPDVHATSAWTARLGTRAVKRIIEENRRLGIPSVCEFRGRHVFEMPDGTLTTDNPFTAPETPDGHVPGA